MVKIKLRAMHVKIVCVTINYHANKLLEDRIWCKVKYKNVQTLCFHLMSTAGISAANLGVVVVVKVIRLLWDGRFLVLCLLVLVAMSWEAQLIVQHGGGL